MSEQSEKISLLSSLKKTVIKNPHAYYSILFTATTTVYVDAIYRAKFECIALLACAVVGYINGRLNLGAFCSPQLIEKATPAKQFAFANLAALLVWSPSVMVWFLYSPRAIIERLGTPHPWFLKTPVAFFAIVIGLMMHFVNNLSRENRLKLVTQWFIEFVGIAILGLWFFIAGSILSEIEVRHIYESYRHYVPLAMLSIIVILYIANTTRWHKRSS